MHVPFSMSDEPDLGDEFRGSYERADEAWQNAVEAHEHCQAANKRAEALLDKIEAKVYTQRQMTAVIQKHIAERQKLLEEIESLRTSFANADYIICKMMARGNV